MDATTAPLICPKCGATMTTYERSGMNIDQCTGCRGIFLDRGELERLMDAESSFYAERGFSAEREPYRERERGFLGGGRYDDDDDDYRWGGRKKRRRGGFLGELFEGGDD